MSHIPRLALVSLGLDSQHSFALWGLLACLRRRGKRVRLFHSAARFCAHDGALSATGAPAHFLDSWLMSPETCREVLAHGFQGRDMAVVEGPVGRVGPRAFSAEESEQVWSAGGSMDRLVGDLSLPVVAVVDVRTLCLCGIPKRPAGLAGIVLDRVGNATEYGYWRTTLETFWGAPVVAAVGEASELRGEFERLAPGEEPTAEWCESVADLFERRLLYSTLLELAHRAPALGAYGKRVFAARADMKGLTVAIAYDKAFHCYAPNTLEALERRGAQLRDFSPLCTADLPLDTDIVYLGCGPVERFASRLAGNHCLKQSLRDFAARGGRIYAEGSGAAYLCRQMQDEAGRLWPMVGVVAADAVRAGSDASRGAEELRLERATWLGEAGARWRGYRNSYWKFDGVGGSKTLARCHGDQAAVVGTWNVVASNVHLDLAMHASALDRFRAAIGALETVEA